MSLGAFFLSFFLGGAAAVAAALLIIVGVLSAAFVILFVPAYFIGLANERRRRRFDEWVEKLCQGEPPK